jgi:hypothetical protein
LAASLAAEWPHEIQRMITQELKNGPLFRMLNLYWRFYKERNPCILRPVEFQIS